MNLEKGNATLADSEPVQPTLVKKPHGDDVRESESRKHAAPCSPPTRVTPPATALAITSEKWS